MTLRTCSVLLSLAAAPLAVAAPNVMVRITNNQPTGGFTFSPLWVAFHDGTFDSFDSGSAASPGIENVAELANATMLSSEFSGSGASGVQTVIASPGGPPPFTPGEMGSGMVDVMDATTNRYFSFASMLVPSNDFFLGNDDPTAYEIFDAGGNFLGPITIQVFSNDAWDAGTEVNDINNGAAFIDGSDATLGATEGGVIEPLFSVAGNTTYLASIVGQQTPIGTLTDGLAQGELVATIQIVPEPTTLAFLGVAGLAVVRRRRR
ncbi:MAG TPA: spondin domain-containing protein [Phycisphaerae bacterium]|nr:spondin domain-containing protein [Phycisphaerae bacterium]